MTRSVFYFGILFLANFLMATVCSYANASVYHVRKDGSDSNCNGSVNASSAMAPNCAVLTVQKGVDLAQPSDTVSVHSGDYSSATINSARTGTASARITISGAGDGTTTLGKTNILLGHDYITMSDLSFSGFPDGTAGAPSIAATLIDIQGAYFEYTRNHMSPTNAGSYGYALGMRTHATHTTISYSTFEAGTVVNGPSFYNVVTLDDGADHALIDHNIIRNMIDVERVFEHWADNPTYSNNEIYNIKTTWPVWCHPDIWQTWGSPTFSNLLIEKNYLHDLQSQIGIVEGGSGSHGNGPWVFRNNVFANIDMCMFIGIWKTYWYNNTFYRASLNCPSPINGGYPGADDMDVRNNVFVGCGLSDYTGWYDFQSGTGDYNFVSNELNGPKGGFSEIHGINGGDTGFINAHPDCVSSPCDFHLAANSALINKGTTITNVSADGTAIPPFSTDKDGNPRTGTWDMGAYEFLNGTPTPVVLVAPKNLHVISQ
ncbi:MAG: choice-of-anchor Q domain-containing protein [Pseudobdellovibrionaceae bacterium]